MYPQRIFYGAIFVLLATGAASRAELLGRHCPSCGCHEICARCRLEIGTKKETKIEYCCECDEICLPGPSHRCVQDSGCAHHPCITWQPTCGKIRTVKKLVKKEVTKEVPAYKCVVEHICPKCGACCDRAERPATLAEITAGRGEQPIRLR